MKSKLILLVEDNEQVLDGNKRMLERAGYETASALTLADARALISQRKPDLIVLDIMLPDGSGLDFMKEMSLHGVPVLLLTGLDTKEDIIRGLTAGGDDYLTKPYNFDELLARVESLLRRAERVPEVIAKGRLSLDVTASVAMHDGTDLLLAKKEFALLLIFVQNEGRYISMDYLYEKVWKAPIGSDNAAIRNAIKRLRTKISCSEWRIEWIRGEGYIFEHE